MFRTGQEVCGISYRLDLPKLSLVKIVVLTTLVASVGYAIVAIVTNDKAFYFGSRTWIKLEKFNRLVIVEPKDTVKGGWQIQVRFNASFSEVQHDC